MFEPVYMDHNATTPVAPAVMDAMAPYFSSCYGNPSSRHEYGRGALKAMDEARQRVAETLGAHPTELVFTSGGTESNNLFLKGAALAMKPGLMAISAMEHPSLREPARQLARQGWRRRELAVDGNGRVDKSDFSSALEDRPALTSVMLVNNETGVIQDVPALADQARAIRTWFHTDAVQALGRLPLNFRQLNGAGVHAMTVSAHKIHGPKGIGALVVDKRLELSPLIVGGGQERGLRCGTENVAAMVGFGIACELAVADMELRNQRLGFLRDQLVEGLVALGARVFGRAAERVSNTVYFAIPDLDGETLVGRLDRAGYAVGSGTACSSASHEPSATLLAMGVSPELARGAVRISLGGANTEAQVLGFLAALAALKEQLLNLTAISA
ncbi:cysteine desulfurase family protein [Denitratisoma oestradiolicum]|uniref:cysteine desulfurase n=1 Tax=Denitratisoma oestradiolicum TaxID=311182 RepID=A0A6S6Y8C4_9PROT|nr:cysteine desulfurase family protein [Denitratisoma oestradiolicum]TWO81564.1 cysteine desulfurase [Denitratisoma oestradiolicum]CAB1368708.1 cysteine desulfurase (tRNA sulfurtransferase), PLP-dependent [Denitratisoma oestradiolicum]